MKSMLFLNCFLSFCSFYAKLKKQEMEKEAELARKYRDRVINLSSRHIGVRTIGVTLVSECNQAAPSAIKLATRLNPNFISSCCRTLHQYNSVNYF